MKIGNTPANTPVKPATDKAKSTRTGKPAPMADAPDVSDTARILSRSQQSLHQLMNKRQDIIQQYAEHIGEPIHLQDRTIDRILQDLRNS